MRLQFEKIPASTQESFHCREFSARAFTYPWHFHPEFELTLILESRGRRLVGDHLADFQPGDLVLLGPNLPHFWFNQEASRQRRARAIVVQFGADFVARQILAVPEAHFVARLLAKASRGLQITGKTRERVAQPMEILPSLRGLPRLLGLLTILNLLASSHGVRPLASTGYRPGVDRQDEARIGKVCAFINRRFTTSISQPAAAKMASLTPSSFSRFFKKKTGKTFQDYVSDMRVGHACRLLLETELSCTEVCHASGFENVSNFNRRFRAQKGSSPREYRRLMPSAELS